MTMTEFSIKTSELFILRKWTDDADIQSMKDLITQAEYFDDESRNMLYNLLLDFTIIKLGNYEKYIRNSLQKIPNYINDKTTKYYVAPLIAPKDRGKPKSSVMLSYLFKGKDLIRLSIISSKKVCVCDDGSQVIENVNKNVDEFLLLVDDFIGSGDTAKSCIEDLVIKGLDIKKVLIVSIACMQEGINSISDLGLSICAGIILKKGIASIKDDRIRCEYIRIMSLIEKKYSISADYQFGYKQSESLIKLYRTPNNTFPVFWSPKVPNPAFPR